MKNRSMKSPFGLACALSAAVLLSACASTPPHNAKLAQAQSRYQTAKNNASVAQAAPKQLQQASQALDKAENLLKQGAPTSDVDHYAYMASRRVDIATQAGRQHQAESAIKHAKAERERAKARESQQKNAQLKQELAQLKAKETQRGLVLTLGNVLFALNKAELKQGATRTVNRLAQFMQEHTERNVMIEGYTDSSGAAAYNQKLSRRRAESVRDALVADGISAQRIVAKGYGEQYPVASNDTASGRQQNRRVEIVISDQDGQFSESR